LSTCGEIRARLVGCGCGRCSPAPPRPLPKIIDQRTTFKLVDIPSLGFIVVAGCEQPSAYHGFAAEVGKVSSGLFQKAASGCCSADCRSIAEFTRAYFEAHPDLGTYPGGTRTAAQCINEQCETGQIARPQPSPQPVRSSQVSSSTIEIEYTPDSNYEVYGEDPFRQLRGPALEIGGSTLDVPPADPTPIQPGLYPNQGIADYSNQL